MKKISLLLALVIFTGLSATSSAQERTDRRGFFLDIAPMVGYESEALETWGGGFSIQLGGGINEQVLVYGVLQGFSTSVDDIQYTFSQILGKVQYFPQAESGFYLNAGLGFGRVSVEADVAGGTFSADSDMGLSLEGGVGYQFRFGQKFYLAPELVNNYSRIEGESVWITAAALRLGWYF